MDFPMTFIRRGSGCVLKNKEVPAPYLRRSFFLDTVPEKADILVCGLGFYELYINGRRITRSALAPFISNPDDLLYYDSYDISPLMIKGENVIGLMLGNGFQNYVGGAVWDFDKAVWRGEACVALSLDMIMPEGNTIRIETDGDFKTAQSPIYFNDLRIGEYYDARMEIPGWSSPGFEDNGWQHAVTAPLPRGEAVLNIAPPIVATEEIKPISVTAQENGYLYDFGINAAGVSRLKVKGVSGQKITMIHGEHLNHGKLDVRNITFSHVPDEEYIQKSVYICKGSLSAGAEPEQYSPTFTYFGFRYIFVEGLTPEQAAPDALTYVIMNTELKERGGFSCSNEIINKLQSITRRSTLANFYHFPTDCPHREKNGWTADAALSAVQTLHNFSPEINYRQWLHAIRKAMDDDGRLPGIVPTGGWGYEKGNGPAWDCVLTYLPYYTYLYRGDETILRENSHAIMRYLEYLTTCIGEDGLIAFGLGDWCPAGRDADQYKVPVAFTDTVISMDICEKAAYIFDVLNKPLHRDFSLGLYAQLRAAVRKRLINYGTMTAVGNCQTSQAMAIFYNVFDAGERTEAFRRLLNIIERDGSLMDVGVLGGRVLFHVLADFGYADLAFNMITTSRFPSYGNWLMRGATSLWEQFQPEGDSVSSLNHHFWGDISHWFIRWLAGIHYNPYPAYKEDLQRREVNIRPCFVTPLNYAEGFYDAPEGRIFSRWIRTKSGVMLNIIIPEVLQGTITLPADYVFDDGLYVKPAVTGEYNILAFGEN